ALLRGVTQANADPAGALHPALETTLTRRRSPSSDRRAPVKGWHWTCRDQSHVPITRGRAASGRGEPICAGVGPAAAPRVRRRLLWPEHESACRSDQLLARDRYDGSARERAEPQCGGGRPLGGAEARRDAPDARIWKRARRCRMASTPLGPRSSTSATDGRRSATTTARRRLAVRSPGAANAFPSRSTRLPALSCRATTRIGVCSAT